MVFLSNWEVDMAGLTSGKLMGRGRQLGEWIILSDSICYLSSALTCLLHPDCLMLDLVKRSTFQQLLRFCVMKKVLPFP